MNLKQIISIKRSKLSRKRQMTMKFSISKLAQHPLNEEIYGQITDDDIKDLLASMDLEGQKEPIVINKDFQIISGNRRFVTAVKLGWAEIEAVQQDFVKDEEEIEIITRNVKRKRKPSQIVNEILRLQKIYSVGQGARTDLKIKSSKFHKNMTDAQNCRKTIANMLNISEGTLDNYLYVANTDPSQFKKIDKDELSISSAAKLLKEKKKTTVKATNNNSKYFSRTNKFVDVEFSRNEHFPMSDYLVKEFVSKYTKAKSDLVKKSFRLDDILSQIILETEEYCDKQIAKLDALYLKSIDSFYRAITSNNFIPYYVTVDVIENELVFNKKECEMKHFLDKSEAKSFEDINIEIMISLIAQSIEYLHYESLDELEKYEKNKVHIIAIPISYRKPQLDDISISDLKLYMQIYRYNSLLLNKELSKDEKKNITTNLKSLYEKVRWLVRDKYFMQKEQQSDPIDEMLLSSNLNKVDEVAFSKN